MIGDGAATARFRALHRPGEPLLLPNGWDVASVAALARAGFTAVGTTSLGVASAHGLPDAVGAARAETLALVRRLANVPVLLTVDIEAGFGDGPDSLATLVEGVAELGAVGVNLEDGRRGGLAPIPFQCELIAAVRQVAPQLFLNARVDTYWQGDAAAPLRQTLDRAAAYREAGADGVFVPGLVADDEIRTVVDSLDVPVNVLYLPGRMSVRRLADLGVARISTGSLLYRAALSSAVDLAAAVRRDEPVAAPELSYQQIDALALRSDRP